MSKLLSPDWIPQISYASKSPVFSNTTKYRNFLRTIPSTIYQTQVIVDILQYFNWTYVSVLVSDDDDGRRTLDKLENLMQRSNMCLAVAHTFDPSFPGNDLEKTILKLKSVYNKTQVVVLWSEFSEGQRLMREAIASGLTDITWIANWGQNAAMTKTNDTIGMFTIELVQKEVPDFKQHLSHIKWNSTLDNPWLEPFWRALSICINETVINGCFKVEPPLGTWLSDKGHQNVMAAVYAIANGLHHYLNCTEKECPTKVNNIDNVKFMKYLNETEFQIPSTNLKYKLEDMYPAIKYQIHQFHPVKKINSWRRKITSPIEVGRWNGESKSLSLSDNLLIWRGGEKPRAKCSKDCLPGSHKVNSAVKCCWECAPCERDSIASASNQHRCLKCGDTQISNVKRTSCINLQNRTLSIESTSFKVLLSFSIFGMLCCSFVILIFIKFWNTPVVKSSSREITLIQLFSILFLFAMPTLYMFKLSGNICIFQIIIFSTLYSQVIAFIVIKTYRLFRVFNDIRFTKVSKYLQNKYQILLSLLLVLLQLVTLLTWYLIYPPKVDKEKYREEQFFVYYCSTDMANPSSIGIDTLLYCVIGYIFFLSVLSGFMAFRARKLPQNFNEAQFIWLCMFISCLGWLLFIPVYLSTRRYGKPMAFLAINTINLFCLLFILYGYKVAIVLFYPHLNTKGYFQKMSSNAVVTTFLQEVNPGAAGDKRHREFSVISFDFDGMFNEYRSMQQNSMTMPARGRSHFPSIKKRPSILHRFNIKKHHLSKKQRANRTKTMIASTVNAHSFPNRSISLDDITVRSRNQRVFSSKNDLTKSRVREENITPSLTNQQNFLPFKIRTTERDRPATKHLYSHKSQDNLYTTNRLKKISPENEFEENITYRAQSYLNSGCSTYNNNNIKKKLNYPCHSLGHLQDYPNYNNHLVHSKKRKRKQIKSLSFLDHNNCNNTLDFNPVRKKKENDIKVHRQLNMTLSKDSTDSKSVLIDEGPACYRGIYPKIKSDDSYDSEINIDMIISEKSETFL